MSKPTKQILIPIFNGICYICYDAKEFTDLTGEEIPPRTLALTSRDKKFAIYLPDVAHLDHELIHLTWFILDHYSVKIDVDNHEMLPYLFEYLKSEIIKD